MDMVGSQTDILSPLIEHLWPRHCIHKSLLSPGGGPVCRFAVDKSRW